MQEFYTVIDSSINVWHNHNSMHTWIRSWNLLVSFIFICAFIQIYLLSVKYSHWAIWLDHNGDQGIWSMPNQVRFLLSTILCTYPISTHPHCLQSVHTPMKKKQTHSNTFSANYFNWISKWIHFPVQKKSTIVWLASVPNWI